MHIIRKVSNMSRNHNLWQLYKVRALLVSMGFRSLQANFGVVKKFQRLLLKVVTGIPTFAAGRTRLHTPCTAARSL